MKLAPWLLPDESQVTADELFLSSPFLCKDLSIRDITQESAEYQISDKGIEISGEDNSQILWGTDALIRSGSFNLTWLTASHSADMPGKRTYVTILRHLSGATDTVLHYYSDDGLNG